MTSQQPPSQSTAGIPPVYPLGDAYLDGGIEEHAWVPVAMADTPEAAVRALAASDWSDSVHQLAQDGMKVTATGERSWHRIADCASCDGDGEDPRVLGDPFGPRPAHHKGADDEPRVR